MNNSLLKKTITEPDKCGCTPEMVNNQLRLIQELLAQYLCSLTMTSVQTNEAIKDIIYQPICMDDISISGMSHYYEHYSILAGYSGQEWSDLIRRYGISGDQAIFWGTEIKNFIEKYTYRNQEGKTIILDYNRFPKQLLRPSVTMLLSFNYTFVADMYCLPQIGFPIHIHGDLQSYNNIIFGYGDELDDDYKSFLKLDDNECLRNIKSIKYLESGNYRSMLAFIESAPYQIYIMGHSCGKSDRTLLNTLFEHKNCVSIKPYYYRKEDGSDNYLDIVQNICRNFTDMKLMRDRVVNKTHCEPLPQSK